MADAAAIIEAASSRFTSLELIGRGSFGDVYKGFDKELNKVVANKVFDLEEAEDEIEDIQKYYGSYLHETKLWIIMEYMAGGSVAELIQRGHPLDKVSIGCILRDLLHAVEYLHNEGKIHINIKAANILLTENGHVKVADFGVSAQLTSTISRRNAKTAIQAGLKSGNPRGKSGMTPVNKNTQDLRKKDITTSGSDSSRNSREFFDAPNVLSKLSQSDDEEKNLVSSAADASIPFKELLIASVKEAFTDNPERPVVHSVINALANMEHSKPGSSEIIINKMLHLLKSSKESSLNDLQDLAASLFNGKLGNIQMSNPVLDQMNGSSNKAKISVQIQI